VNNFVALTHCYFCNEGKDILINQRLRDISHLHKKVVYKEPCPKCADLMRQGVMLVSVRDGEQGDNPYRTGKMVVVRDEAVKRIFGPTCVAVTSRFAFVPDSVWIKVGLPTNEKESNAVSSQETTSRG